MRRLFWKYWASQFVGAGTQHVPLGQRESADAGRDEEAKSQGVDDTTAHLTPPSAPREPTEPREPREPR